jgi:hypothetical protein
MPKIKYVTDKANKALAEAEAKAIQRGWVKWGIVALAVSIVVLIAVLLWPATAHATGAHMAYGKIAAAKAAAAKAAAAQAAAQAAAAKAAAEAAAAKAAASAATTSASSAPPAASQTPATGGGGSGSAVGYYVMGGVAIYFGYAIYSHWIWCAQREEEWHRDNRVARCYNAERDGLPR